METREDKEVWTPLGMPREDKRFATAAILGLLALSILFGAMLFFSRQDLGAAERETASLRSDLRSERELLEDLEAQIGDLEGTANAAQIEVESVRATAAKCMTELLRATNASLEFRYGDALFWLRESRRTCRPILENEGGLL